MLNFDLIEGQWDRIECPAHPGQPLAELTDCPDHGFACKKCYWECKICQRPRCSKCARTKCRGCQENHCDTCVLSCSFCSGAYCPSSTQSCQGGCGPVCRGCSIDFRGTGLVRCKACVVETNGCHHRELRELVVRCAVGGEECCSRCITSCSDCKRVVCFTHLGPCALCPPGQLTCQVCSPHLLPDGRRACRRHADYCSCGVYELKKRITVCPEHDRACPSCTWACTACNRKGCSACPQVHCQGCTSVHCQACSVQCASCKGSFCSKTTRQCEAGCGPVCTGCSVELRGSKRCRKCVVVTNYCKHLESREAVVTCPVGKEELCSACAQAVAPRCSVCKKQFCSQHVGPCAEGHHMVCDRCSLGLLEGERACPQHAERCACGKLALKSGFAKCPTHGPRCPNCRWQCPSCEKIRCSDCQKAPCSVCKSDHCSECCIKCRSCRETLCRKSALTCSSGCGQICPSCAIPTDPTHPLFGKPGVSKLQVPDGKVACRNCSQICNCGHLVRISKVVRCQFGETYCQRCAPTLVLACGSCGKSSCVNCFKRCAGGQEPLCKTCPTVTTSKGERSCQKHATKCGCGRIVLVTVFSQCDAHVGCCPECRWHCHSCSAVGCSQCARVRCEYCHAENCANCVEPCPVCLTMQNRPSSGQFCKSHRCLDCGGQLGCAKHQRLCTSCGQTVCHGCLKGNSCQACRTFRIASLEEEGLLRQFETELKRLQVPDWKGQLEVSTIPARRKLFRIRHTLSSWMITVADDEVRHVLKSSFFGLGRRDLKGDS